MPCQKTSPEQASTMPSTDKASVNGQCETSIEISRDLRIILALFPLPFIIFAITSGNHLTYILTYGSWIFLANVKLFSIGLFGKRPSHLIVFIALIFFVNLFATLPIQSADNDEAKLAILLKAILFLNMLYIFDLMRPFGLRKVFAPAVPVAVLGVTASLVHLIINPEMHFDRHLYFGLQPNLGGEILFALLILVFWGGSRSIFLILLPVVFYCMFLLQSRAAILALVIFFTFFAGLYFIQKKRAYALALTAGASSLYFFLFLPQVEYIVKLFLERAMLVNDQYRGLNTGFTGRTETWQWALELFSQRPFFGYGLDQSPSSSFGLDIHSGPLLIVAEFGIFGILLLITIILIFFRKIFKHQNISPVLLACFVLLLFAPRAINMNIFPLIMWIALLPWPKDQIDWEARAIGVTRSERKIKLSSVMLHGK